MLWRTRRSRHAGALGPHSTQVLEAVAAAEKAVLSAESVLKADGLSGGAVEKAMEKAEAALEAAEAAEEASGGATPAEMGSVVADLNDATLAVKEALAAAQRSAADTDVLAAVQQASAAIQAAANTVGEAASALQQAAAPAVTAAGPVVKGAAEALASTDAGTLSEGALGVIAVATIAPSAFKLGWERLRGYAGAWGDGLGEGKGARDGRPRRVPAFLTAKTELSAPVPPHHTCAGDVGPTAVFDAIVSQTPNTAVLLDIRSAEEKGAQGVPDLPGALLRRLLLLQLGRAAPGAA